MMPHIRMNEQLLRKEWSLNRSGVSYLESFLDAAVNPELIVIIGFLTMLLIEQIVYTRGTSHKNVNCQQVKSGMISQSKLGFPDEIPKIKGEEDDSPSLTTGDDRKPLVLDRLDVLDSDSEESTLLQSRTEFRGADEVETTRRCHNDRPHHHIFGLTKNGLTLHSCFLLFGLSTHSIFEGVALGVQNDKAEFYRLLLAIMMHEVLCSFSFGISLAHQKTPFAAGGFAAIFLAACIPISLCLSLLIGSLDTSLDLSLRFILEGLAAGTFVYVACVEMLSSELHSTGQNNENGLNKALAVVAGVIFFYTINEAFGRHAYRSVLPH
ncbi:hypothetical protein AB6A40_003588 [Gnathostoma spinigerum]|uniref:Zinc transporter ZIP3 n=1 Tax=Gnathostoma spinigerum TaxID=75299 RepID=A0ABD6EHR7_9BILA